jgi:hypothetical protein
MLPHISRKPDMTGESHMASALSGFGGLPNGLSFAADSNVDATSKPYRCCVIA